MKLAWVSAPPWANTGYGKVTREFIRRIKYPEIECIATGGLQTGPFVEWEGIKVFPGMSAERNKGDIIVANLEKLLKDTGATHWLIHNDAWAYSATVKDVGQKYPCMTYSPIDGGHVSARELEALIPAQERVAMCKYAQEEIQKMGLSAVYIPHGVDTNIYKPQDKDDWRDYFQLPKDEFIFGFIGTNISKRKGQFEMFYGLKKAMDAGAKFKIVMITNLDGRNQGGYHLWELADYVGLPRDKILLAAKSFEFTEEELAGWYNSFDVLVNLSRGEGFGIPMLESQACGTPVITTKFSACTELVDGHGICIPPKAIDCYTLKTQYLAISDYDKFGEEAIRVINNPDLVKSMGKRACKFAQKYEWDKIAPSWDRMFRRVDNEGFFPPYKIKEFK